MVLISAGDLNEYIAEIFAKAGCNAVESARIADNLVEANLTGHDSHGVIRTPRYVQWLSEGKLLAGRETSTVSDAGAMLVLDGNYGFGQTVGRAAVEQGIERCLSDGFAVVALRHAGHLGRIGAWAEMAVEAGLVSMHFVNVAGSILVAPFGGVDRRMSTNPVTIGLPVADGAPVILDFATSAVAEGKVLVAAKGGKALPEGVLIGPDGEPGNDPWLLYGDVDPGRTPDLRNGPGALRTMGDHKGSGLALVCELLAGALTGSGCTRPDLPRVYNGMLSIYMSPDRFGDDEFFKSETQRYLDYFRQSRSIPGVDQVLTPGEPERRAREERLAGGVPLAADAWQAIAETASGVGVTAPVVTS